MRFEGAGLYAIWSIAQVPHLEWLDSCEGDYLLYIGSGHNGVAPLWGRLERHAASISAAHNLNLNNFRAQVLVSEMSMQDVETRLIAKHCPPWNGTGFGNKTVGVTREDQRVSAWDTLYPGRTGIAASPRSIDKIIARMTRAQAFAAA